MLFPNMKQHRVTKEAAREYDYRIGEAGKGPVIRPVCIGNVKIEGLKSIL